MRKPAVRLPDNDDDDDNDDDNVNNDNNDVYDNNNNNNDNDDDDDDNDDTYIHSLNNIRPNIIIIISISSSKHIIIFPVNL